MDPILESGSLPLGVHKPLPGWKRKVNTAAFIFALFAGGFGTGFIYSQRQADNFIALQRADHLSEIERLQKAHQLVIGNLATSAVAATKSAATATESAATATQNAAAATGQAAKAVESATVQKFKR